CEVDHVEPSGLSETMHLTSPGLLQTFEVDGGRAIDHKRAHPALPALFSESAEGPSVDFGDIGLQAPINYYARHFAIDAGVMCNLIQGLAITRRRHEAEGQSFPQMIDKELLIDSSCA